MNRPINGDQETTIADLKILVQTFVDEREWQKFHNPKNLVMSLSIEVGELMEHYQWLTPAEADAATQDPENRREIADEMADCLAYLVSLASRLDVDLSTALAEKMVKNAVKYPVESSRGVAKPNPGGQSAS